MGEQIEHGLATLFWKSETDELKPLETSDAKFNIEPPSNWVQEDKSGFNFSFDFQVPKESIKPIYKLFKRRLPRKFKKQYKLRMTKRYKRLKLHVSVSTD